MSNVAILSPFVAANVVSMKMWLMFATRIWKMICLDDFLPLPVLLSLLGLHFCFRKMNDGIMFHFSSAEIESSDTGLNTPFLITF
jgi:hypothetical protein